MHAKSPARLVIPAQLPDSAWANGSGYTKEIGVGSAPRAEYSSSRCSRDYHWRLSLAELTRSADFSVLPGIDRVFTLVSPGPLAMTVGGAGRTLRLGQKAAFAGEAPVTIQLGTNEPQLGLNLMTRRGTCLGNVTTEFRNGKVLLDPGAGIVAATVIAGAATLLNGEKLADLTTILLSADTEELEAENCLLAVVSVYGP